ncbi:MULTISPECIES: efflux RND transporter periplasmic adaptor subunit [Acidithiobacillus]|uniref:efflux RND transporter periplasmic adaptor subunit n=1 Tax=Acidithiobacillus TaxID=119977 RepID=UPI00094ACFBD|nr:MULTISPECIES: efflux RND transporter periplasmic adaptor subunit [Acidithiobacillus]MBE7563673.1 efflux RND transporter periplasmic adaptor subunit [Acidithiobacillus sp. HP-6]MBE7569448.1 efflux RND transporter periplasmic adaptor subunit [Acidithiobacillus sp. HP-2]
MKKAFLFLGLIVVLLFAAIYGWHSWRQQRLQAHLAAKANPAVTVSATQVREHSLAGKLTAVGEIVPQQGAVLSPQVGGVIEKLYFHSGQTVTQGQLLLSLNPGNLPGQLQAAQAHAELTQVDYQRAQKVYAIHGISTAALDKAKFDAQAAQGQVAALQESLADTQIRAPFSGMLSLRTVNAGEYIHADTPVVHLENLHHLYVDFTVPQRDAKVLHPGAPVQIDIHDGEKVKHYVSTVYAISSHVDAANRAISVRGIVKAAQGLKPGMFVQVDLQKSAPKEMLMIPTVSVSFNTYGDFVYVLTSAESKHHLIAKEQKVVTGIQRGKYTAIISGLKAGETVVTAGQVKLHSGDSVHINNAAHL